MILNTRDFGLGPELTKEYDGLLPIVLDKHLPEHRDELCIAMEFGVGSGGSLRKIAAEYPCFGFDSFQGLPEDWRKKFPKGSFAQTAEAVEEIKKMHDVIIVEGMFEETLPKFPWMQYMSRVDLVHVDCDLYSSTKTVLQNVKPCLWGGTVVVFDEYHGYDGHEHHEMKAWKEFADENDDLEWLLIGHGPQQWAIEIISDRLP